ncbi:MAG: restriction endonuclease [Opitutae bacterium]|nr:restriction endonuclease [Opitutae bacterium]
MKLVHEEFLLGQASSATTGEFADCLSDIRSAIKNVVWPENSRTFTIHPVVDGNGVLPIKVCFVRKLKTLGWRLEDRPVLAQGLGPGKIDALKPLADGRQFAAEWETGNISSSNRALNKICMGIIEGQLAGGVLILPDRELYRFLTQRIGNYKELAPYFPVYRHLKAMNGLLAVFAVSFDRTSSKVALIPKGMDGHSLQRRSFGR